MTAEREPCAFCGDQHWTEAHYAAGRLVCKLCWQGRKPATSMPPTEAGRRAIAAWIAPRQPRQQTLRLGEMAQPQGASHG